MTNSTELKGSIYGLILTTITQWNDFMIDSLHALLMGTLGAVGGYVATKFLKRYWK